MVIIASLFEKRGPGVYHNTAGVIDADGRFLGKYREDAHYRKIPVSRKNSISRPVISDILFGRRLMAVSEY